jgi:hypothetical protein
MTGLRVVIAVIWMVALLAGRGLWLSASPSPIAATSAEITEPEPAPAVDLFGNEIEKALADYRLDVGGGVYERHSPDTALPRLGSPTT